jgi:hypothetical protein
MGSQEEEFSSDETFAKYSLNEVKDTIAKMKSAAEEKDNEEQEEDDQSGEDCEPNTKKQKLDVPENWKQLATDDNLHHLTKQMLTNICRNLNLPYTKRIKVDLIKSIRVKLGYEHQDFLQLKTVTLKLPDGKTQIANFAEDTSSKLKAYCRLLNLPCGGPKAAMWEKLVLYSTGNWKDTPTSVVSSKPPGSTKTNARTVPEDPYEALERELGGKLFIFAYMKENISKEYLFTKQHLLLRKATFYKIEKGLTDMLQLEEDWPYGDTSKGNALWDGPLTERIELANRAVATEKWEDAFIHMMILVMFAYSSDTWIYDNEIWDYNSSAFWGFFTDFTVNWRLILRQPDSVLGLNMPKGIEGGYRKILEQILRKVQKEINTGLKVYDGGPNVDDDDEREYLSNVDIFEDFDGTKSEEDEEEEEED